VSAPLSLWGLRLGGRRLRLPAAAPYSRAERFLGEVFAPLPRGKRAEMAAPRPVNSSASVLPGAPKFQTREVGRRQLARMRIAAMRKFK
jgi:hypothetical protein